MTRLYALLSMFLTWCRRDRPPTCHTPIRVALRRPWPGTRRGLKLWMISIILGVKGAGVLAGQGTATSDDALAVFVQAIDDLARNLLPDTLADLLPVDTQVVGACIVAMCAAAAFTAYCHHGRDRYGYNLVACVAMGWVGVFLVAPLAGAPLSSLQGALSYAVIFVFVLYSASDPEPHTLEPMAVVP